MLNFKMIEKPQIEEFKNITIIPKLSDAILICLTLICGETNLI